MGVASLVLGIVALVVVLFPFLPTTLGIILGIVGLILGALGRQNPETKGLATGGLVMSIIAVVLGIAVYVACASAASAVNSLF